MDLIEYLIWYLIGDPMTHIYSSAALKTRQREVKDAARENVVHITENGNAAFVLMSEELFERKLREAAEDAAYEERLRASLLNGEDDFTHGRYVEGIDAFDRALAERLSERG